MFKFIMACLIFTMGIFSVSNASLAKGEEEAVLQAIETLFEAMHQHDAELASTVLMEDGILRSTREKDGEIIIQTTSHESLIAAIGSGGGVWVERYWNPIVFVSSGIAMIWVNYDFHVDGKLSHCGIDLFSMVKQESRWKISSVLDTREVDDCEDSPLGPLAAE